MIIIPGIIQKGKVQREQSIPAEDGTSVLLLVIQESILNKIYLENGIGITMKLKMRLKMPGKIEKSSYHL